MKLSLTIILILTISISISGQIDNSKSTLIHQDTSQTKQQNCFNCPDDSSNYKLTILPTYFLLGTLSDYMGRFQYIDKDKQVDRYYPYEEPLAVFLAKYIQENYASPADTVFKESRHSEIYSKQLAITLNKFYGSDGNLIDSFFNDEEKIYSFLLGNYYRYGKRLTDKIYKIQIANSSKDKLLYTMLKKVHCDKLLYKFLRGNIPTSHIFYFEAPPRLIKYFNTLETEKQKLSIYYYKKIIEPIFKDKLKGKYEENNKKEAKRIEEAFE